MGGQAGGRAMDDSGITQALPVLSETSLPGSEEKQVRG